MDYLEISFHKKFRIFRYVQCCLYFSFVILFTFQLFFIQPVFSSPSKFDSTLILQPDHSEVRQIIKGTSYILLYDPFYHSSNLIPTNHGEYVSGNLGLTIQGESNSNVRVEFELPDSIYNRDSSRSSEIIFPSFGQGGSMHDESGNSFNPHISNIYRTTSNGKITLRLGYKFTTQFNNAKADTFLALIHCRAEYSNLYTSSTVTESTDVQLKIIEQPAISSLILNNCTIEGIYKPLTYSVAYDTINHFYFIKPHSSGEDINGNAGITISGIPTTKFKLTLTLPDSLYSNISLHSLPINFPDSGIGSSIITETKIFFNPNITDTFIIPNGGTLNLQLGFNFSVPFVPINEDTFFTSLGYSVTSFVADDSLLMTSDTLQSKIKVIMFDNKVEGGILNGNINVVSVESTYTISYRTDSGKSIISPRNYGENVVSDFGINVSGEISANLAVKFILPDSLSSQSGNKIGISFPYKNPTYAYRLEINQYFNPNRFAAFNLGPVGKASLRLGYQIKLPSNIFPGVYSVSFPCYAYYVATSDTIVPNEVEPFTLHLDVNVNPPNAVSEAELMNTYVLTQNYPNPFNPSTNFEFRIANRELVTLKIYNLLGLEVATVINEQLPPGSYARTWNAEGFPSGIYYYRIQTENTSETKKLLLLR